MVCGGLQKCAVNECGVGQVEGGLTLVGVYPSGGCVGIRGI